MNCFSTTVSFQLLKNFFPSKAKRTLEVLKKASAGQTIIKMITTGVESNKSAWEGDKQFPDGKIEIVGA